MSTQATERPTRRALLDIAADIRDILRYSEGEVTQPLEDLADELSDKVDAYYVVASELEAQVKLNLELSRELSREYADKANAAQKKLERLLQHLDIGLQRAGTQDVRGRVAHAFYKVTTAVEVQDEERFILNALRSNSVPTYMRAKPAVWTIDKKELRALLEAGVKVPDAQIVERRHLQLR